MNKHIVNAVIAQVFNVMLAGFIIAFLWSVSPFFATAIVGLSVMKYIANYIFVKEYKRAEQEAFAAFQQSPEYKQAEKEAMQELQKLLSGGETTKND